MADDPEDWRAAYIAGIVDNHCGIVVTVGKGANRAIGYRVSTECRIKLDSEATVQLLTDFCDDHGINYRSKTQEETTYDHYRVIISQRKSVQDFLNTVRPYLVARDTAIEILCDSVIPMLEAGAHQEQATFIELMEDIERFREAVGRANRAKYDLEYFRDEWDIDA